MYKSILLPVDLGHKSSWEKAAPEAVALAKQHGAKIHLLTVIPDFGMAVVGSFFPSDYAEQALQSSSEKLASLASEIVPDDLLAKVHTAHGSAYQEIINTAKKQGCDLIVMASHRPEMSDYLLGPNAARVARHADQSVMIVRN
ncbi:universal stress protein [Anderseniella sp. Alg231-50]|uniref:universal stress protein n=1 Tax=Anderseniella sp. Alg231-50 TaxID=1922226 RepID=UPI000D555D27